jgi:hypothetical protein
MFSLLWASRAPVLWFSQIYAGTTAVQIIPGETLMAGDGARRFAASATGFKSLRRLQPIRKMFPHALLRTLRISR